MMKFLTFPIFACILLSPLSLGAQKHDYVWMMGGRSQTNIDFAGIVIDFNTLPPDIYHEFREMNFSQANASICDTAGNLLFYTNGIYIANALGEPMENGTGLNPGPHAEQWQNYGYILDQGALALPVPERDSLYYLLHADKEFTPDMSDIVSENFRYSLIDMRGGGGLGSVAEKNAPIKSGSFQLGKLTAAKHANGRDWWVLLREHRTSRFFRFLVTPSGVVELDDQQIGPPILRNGVGQACFSPQGDKYAVYESIDLVEGHYLNIYGFDRCTGLLNTPLQFNMVDSAWSGGAAFSPSGRFLYVSSFRYLYQYDLEAADIEASRITVAEWDGFHDTLLFSPGRATTFYLAQLAPDGKIYINSNNTVSYLHVINEPDSLGLACEVCQHCVDLPSVNSFSMPNFPNYRLGHLEGSPCDTLRAPPVAAWRYEPGGLSVAFEDESYHDIRTWHWDFGDGATDSLPAPVHEYAAAGAYEVCLTVSNPRGNDTRCQVVEVVPSSSREAVAGRRFWVGPNPASNHVGITLAPPLPHEALWHLRGLQGRALRSGALPPGQPLLMLDLAGLPGGVYVFELALPDGGRFVEKVVVVAR